MDRPCNALLTWPFLFVCASVACCRGHPAKMQLSMIPSFRSAIATIIAAGAGFASAQVPDPAVVAKIKAEGLDHSQVATTLSYLTDVIGPRLTGSPSMKRANEWTRDTMAKWGLSNAHLEAWGPFGRGWVLDRFQAQVSSPQCIPLIAFPKAWCPGVNDLRGVGVVLVDVKTEEELNALKGKLHGKIVLNGGTRDVAARFTPQGTRYTDEQLAAMASAAAPAPGGGQNRRAGGAQPAGLSAAVKLRFFVAEGAAAVLDCGNQGDDGTIFVQSAAVPTPAPAPGAPPATPGGGRRGPSAWDANAPATVPQVVVSVEQYNRMVRMIRFGESLKMDLDLKVHFTSNDLMAYNTVAELPGTDKADEVVMVGGHMDSWHSGTGATDNGAGLVVAMEAVRILKATGLTPRRTIRVALWSGEEEGLFGSRAYVAQHFGEREPAPVGSTPTTPAGPGGVSAGAPPRKFIKKPEFDKISAYFNLDNGTGKIRGIYQQGNAAVGPIFGDWLKPIADMGATTLTIRNTGSTDHVSFDGIGIPGFQFIQDTIEYGVRTHHSNQDVYDRIQIDDLKQAAVIMATFLYQTGMRDELLPRKAAAG